jgi:hypothetical protein
MRELPEEFVEMAGNAKDQILNGLMNFVVTSLVYSLGLFLVTRVLASADVISWQFSWIQCTSLVLGFNFVRLWDRAFMR